MSGYLDPQLAAQAWAEEHGWELVADSQLAGHMTAYINLPPEGRRKTGQRMLVGYFTSWASFAGRLMSSGLIVKSDDGWTFDTAREETR